MATERVYQMLATELIGIQAAAASMWGDPQRVFATMIERLQR